MKVLGGNVSRAWELGEYKDLSAIPNTETSQLSELEIISTFVDNVQRRRARKHETIRINGNDAMHELLIAEWNGGHQVPIPYRTDNVTMTALGGRCPRCSGRSDKVNDDGRESRRPEQRARLDFVTMTRNSSVQALSSSNNGDMRPDRG